MVFTAFRGIKPWYQLIMTAFVVLICFVFLFVISVLAAIPFTGLPRMVQVLSGASLDGPSAVALLKYFQLVQSTALFVVPPFILGWLFCGNARGYLHLDRPAGRIGILISVLVVLVINPFVSWTGELNSAMHLPGFLAGTEAWMRQMEDQAAALIDRFMEVKSLGGLLFNLLLIAVIPALGEEFLFRGVVQRIFTGMSRSHHAGIWIAAFLFSALHFQFYGFVPRMVLGAAFGYMLVYSGSLWLPVLSHFVNNALGVLLLYVEKQHPEVFEPFSVWGEKLTSGYPAALLSLVLTVLLFLLLRNRTYAGRAEQLI